MGQETPFLGELGQWNLKSLLVMISLSHRYGLNFCVPKIHMLKPNPGDGIWWNPLGDDLVMRVELS